MMSSYRSLLLPGPIEADEWLHKVRANRHMWQLEMTSHPAANQLPTETFMRKETQDSLQKSLAGWKIHTRGQMSTESNGNANLVVSGSQRKLLLNFCADGSALLIFNGLINKMCCRGNRWTTTSE